MNYARYMEILTSMTTISGCDDYRLLFSLRPGIILAVTMFVWMGAFVFVLVCMMDDSDKSKLMIHVELYITPDPTFCVQGSVFALF